MISDIDNVVKLALAGHRPCTPGFLKLLLCGCPYVCLCLCLLPRLQTTSGVIWTPYDWVNKFYSIYMAATIVISSGCGLGIEAGLGK